VLVDFHNARRKEIPQSGAKASPEILLIPSEPFYTTATVYIVAAVGSDLFDTTRTPDKVHLC
jgi:hypothetical protein